MVTQKVERGKLWKRDPEFTEDVREGEGFKVQCRGLAIILDMNEREEIKEILLLHYSDDK